MDKETGTLFAPVTLITRFKTKINPLKLIVTDAQNNFVQDFYHQLRSGVIMKQSAKPA